MRTSYLLDLPPEILLRIVEFSPPSSLKLLRQVCSSLRVLADPHLFHTVAIYPHRDRFEQVSNISLHPALCAHVKSLVYDNHYIDIPDCIIYNVGTSYGAGAYPDSAQAIEDRAWDFKKSVLQPRRDDEIELLYPYDILRHLPNLESITCRENRFGNKIPAWLDLDDLPELYASLRRTPSGSYTHDCRSLHPASAIILKQSAARVLVASAKAHITTVKSFTIENGYWTHIVNFQPGGKHIDMLAPFIANLQTLEISAGFSNEDDHDLLTMNLGSVLNLATSLQKLHLDFGRRLWTQDFHVQCCEPRPVSDLSCLLRDGLGEFEPASWPQRLSSLSLVGLYCYKSDIRRLLRKLQPRLDRFSLSEVSLLPRHLPISTTSIEPFKAECLVKLLHDIRQRLRLESVHLSGSFSNTQDQVFHFESNCDNDQVHLTTTAARIERFILDGGECPLDGLAIQDGAMDMTAEQADANEALNDKSFQIGKSFFQLWKERAEKGADPSNPGGFTDPSW